MTQESLEVRRRSESAEPLGFLDWQKLVHDEFVRLDYEPENNESFRGSFSASEVGELVFADLWHEAIRVTRSSRNAQTDTEHFYKFSLQLDGYSIIAQNERESLLKPGDLGVYATHRPFTYTAPETSRTLIVVLPASALQLSPRLARKITAVKISGDSSLGVIASKYVIEVREALRKGSIRPSMALADSVISVLRSTLINSLDDTEDSADEQLVKAILETIEQRLGDRDLTQNEIAKIHHISVRQLQRIFQEQGTTFTHWLQSRRLDNCRLELESGSRDDSTLHEIAFDWGIPDASYFSRIFRRRFGKSPSEYRHNYSNRLSS